MADIEERLSESEIKQFLNLSNIDFSGMEGKIIGDNVIDSGPMGVSMYIESLRYEVGDRYVKLGVIEKHDISDFISGIGFFDAGKIISEEEFKELMKKYGYTVTQKDLENLPEYKKGESLNAFESAYQIGLFDDEKWLTTCRLEVLFEMSEDYISEEDSSTLVFTSDNEQIKFNSEDFDASQLSINLSDFADVNEFNNIVADTAYYNYALEDAEGRFQLSGKIYQ